MYVYRTKFKFPQYINEYIIEYLKDKGIYQSEILDEQLKRKINDIYNILDFEDTIRLCKDLNKIKFAETNISSMFKNIETDDMQYYFNILNKYNISIDDSLLDSIINSKVINEISLDEFLKACNSNNIKLSSGLLDKAYRSVSIDGDKFLKICLSNNIQLDDELITEIIFVNSDIPGEFENMMKIFSKFNVKLNDEILLDVYSFAREAFGDKDNLIIFNSLSEYLNVVDKYGCRDISDSTFESKGKFDISNITNIRTTDSSFEIFTPDEIEEDEVYDVILDGKAFLAFKGKLISLDKDNTEHSRILNLEDGDIKDSETGEVLYEGEDLFAYEHNGISIKNREGTHLSETSKFAILSNMIKNGKQPDIINFNGTDNLINKIESLANQYGIKNGRLFLNNTIVSIRNGKIEKIINYDDFLDSINGNEDIVVYPYLRRNNISNQNVSIFQEQDYDGAKLFDNSEEFEAFKFMLENAFYHTEDSEFEDRIIYTNYTTRSGPYNNSLRLFYFGLGLQDSGSLMDSYEMINEMNKPENGLKSPIIVTRGCSIEAILGNAGISNYSEDNIIDLLSEEGLIITEDAFSSCGICKGKEFDGTANLEIVLPKGTKGVFLDPISAYAGDGLKMFCAAYQGWIKSLKKGKAPNISDFIIDDEDMVSECEFLLQAGSKFVIEKIEKTNNLDEGDEPTYNIRLRLVAQEPVGFCERLAKWIEDTYDVEIDSEILKHGLLS